jgi:hypothetical protein
LQAKKLLKEICNEVKKRKREKKRREGKGKEGNPLSLSEIQINAKP